MFADASQRKFEILLFWSLNRLSREGALETLQHLNRRPRTVSTGVHSRNSISTALASSGMLSLPFSLSSPSRSAFACQSAPLQGLSGQGAKARRFADRALTCRLMLSARCMQTNNRGRR